VSAKKPGVKKNIDGLKVIQTSLAKLHDGNHIVRVGIFGDKGARKDEQSGMTNAEIGFIHEMGSIQRNIPRRSFLWDTFSGHGKRIMLELKPLVENLFKKGKVDDYLKRVGVASVSLVQEAFQTSGWGAWPPNAYSTILRKLRKGIKSLGKRRQMAAEVIHEGAGHAKPLMDTNQLFHSIDYRVVKA
jgi:hypothetical protein